MDAVKDEAVVDVPKVMAAKRECELAILAALNKLERQTGMECGRVTPAGQKTVDGRVLTAEVGVEMVLR